MGTLLRTDNVSFLIGAGCSLAAEGVSLARLPFQIERKLLTDGHGGGTPAPWLTLLYTAIRALSAPHALDPGIRSTASAAVQAAMTNHGPDSAEAKAAITAFEVPVNLEALLSILHVRNMTLVGGASLTHQQSQIDKAHLETLVLRLTTALADVCRLPRPDNIAALLNHRRFIKKLLTRPLNLSRVNLFTLNYDTLVEQAADAEDVIAVDGFVETLRRIFRPESFDHDMYFPARTTEGRVHRLDRVIHLYKLHGSVTWRRTDASWENPYGLHATFPSETATISDVLIYPTPLKQRDALGLPYSELFRRFAASVVQPQSVLFVAGYGFADDHVNALVRQALAVPSFTLIVIDPAPVSAFVTQLQALADQRIVIISGPQLGTFAGFSQTLLPDLTEEQILQKVIQTHNAL